MNMDAKTTVGGGYRRRRGVSTSRFRGSRVHDLVRGWRVCAASCLVAFAATWSESRVGTAGPTLRGQIGALMNCESCGWSNATDNRFCGQCGTAFPVGCPVRALLPAGQPFCGQCGEAVPGAAGAAQGGAATQGPPSISELRLASVLFVDLVEYTPLTQGWDAEEVRQLLTGYYEVASTIVQRYGGVVEKFIGDAVVAAWGARLSREDDAARAVRAGLEIVAAVSAHGEANRVPGLAARAGVVTGQVGSWSGAGPGLVAWRLGEPRSACPVRRGAWRRARR